MAYNLRNRSFFKWWQRWAIESRVRLSNRRRPRVVFVNGGTAGQ